MSKIAIAIGISLIILLVIKGYSQMTEHYLQDDPMLIELKETVKPIFNTTREKYGGNLTELNHINLMDTVSLYKGNKSYTLNKEKVFLCLKDENDKYYNKNMLVFVLLHELAHCICDEIGHTQKFHDIFQELLAKATEKGIYNPSIPVIQDYCEYDS